PGATFPNARAAAASGAAFASAIVHSGAASSTCSRVTLPTLTLASGRAASAAATAAVTAVSGATGLEVSCAATVAARENPAKATRRDDVRVRMAAQSTV